MAQGTVGFQPEQSVTPYKDVSITSRNAGHERRTPMSIHYAEIEYGFDYGSAKVTRLFSDEKLGWITLGIETPKYSGNGGLQVYITKTGKVRIHDSRGEWTPPTKK